MPHRHRLAAALAVIMACAGVALTAPSAEAGATTYRLAYATTPDGAKRVVRWNPCQVITYRVNATRAGATPAARTAALNDVKAAVAKLSAATGIRFLYEGTTAQIPTSTATQAWWRRQTTSELVVAWVDQRYPSSRSTLLGKDSSGRWAAGTGGYVTKSWSTGGPWQVAAGRGYLVLDAAQRAKFRAGFGSGVTRGSLLLHELGHVMGLGHVSVTSQTMYPVILSRSSAAYQLGDRTGLTKVGRSAGCIPVPAAVWPAI